MPHYFDTLLPSGTPATVTYTMHPREPEVGIMGEWAELESVVNGRGEQVEFDDDIGELLDQQAHEHYHSLRWKYEGD